MKLRDSFKLSTGLHASPIVIGLILSLLGVKGCPGCSGKGGGKDFVQFEVKDGTEKKKGGEAEGIEMDLMEGNIEPPPSKDAGRSEPGEGPGKRASADCPHDWYGGLGLVFDDAGANIAGTTFGRVAEAVDGYPGKAAGIRRGDLVSNPNGIRGEVGTTVHLIVLRNPDYDPLEQWSSVSLYQYSVQLSMDVTRARICVEKEGKP